MKPIRLWPRSPCSLARSAPLHAADDPVFPPGIRVGLTPLVGLVRAKTFVGFETEDHSVKVLVDGAAGRGLWRGRERLQGQSGRHRRHQAREHRDVRAGIAYYTAESAKDGATSVRRYSMILPGGTFSGYVAVQVPENAAKIYTDDAVRQMFASAASARKFRSRNSLA